MIERDEHPSGIELWNVAEGATTVVGAQDRFLALGRIRDVSNLKLLTYSLNGSADRPVACRTADESAGPSRLSAPGDFSIDTIDSDQLRSRNHLRLTAWKTDGEHTSRNITFSMSPLVHAPDEHHVDPSYADHAQELCQLVDGRWQRTTDSRGRPCVQISPADAGYDRVALFTLPLNANTYTVTTRLRVDAWLHPLHNVGLVFDWRSHRPGDGHDLPREWTTGLGYYFSHCAGLRLRVGQNVTYDAQGRRSGDRVLAENPVSSPRAALARMSRRVTGGTGLRQLATGRDYWFRLRVAPEHLALTVWRDGRAEPSPQVVAPMDGVTIPPGAAGIIAHFSAVNVYEFHYEAGTGVRRVAR